MNTLKAIPAYGREYDNHEALIADWLAGKDFQIDGGSYFSIRDYDYLAITLNYDDICIAHDYNPISSVSYINLFKPATPAEMAEFTS
jgi:hypothetical protein